MKKIYLLCLVLLLLSCCVAATPSASMNAKNDGVSLNGPMNVNIKTVEGTDLSTRPPVPQEATREFSTGAGSDYTFQWATPSNSVLHPQYVDTDSSGNVYVTDFWNNSISKYSPDGTELLVFGSPGTGNGQFGYPGGVAVNATGYVYVADLDNNRMELFAPSGMFVRQWGAFGSEEGNFNGPRGVAVGGSGDVYVIDRGNNRVQKFGPDGNYLTQWGSYGTGDGYFDKPTEVVVNGTGHVFVTDSNNNRVQVFNATGSYESQFGVWSFPWGITVDGSDNVYVTAANSFQVQKFDSSGILLTQWGYGGSGNGQFWSPYGIAVSAGGHVYVADSNNYRLEVFTPDGTHETTWGTGGNGDGHFIWPTGIAVGTNGNVYVLDYGNSRVQELAADGTYVTQWGNGQFYQPYGITMDGNGDVLVSDTNNNRIMKFGPDGTYLTQWGSAGSGDGFFNWPEGIAVAGNGNVYVVDCNNNRVQVFDPDGTYLSQWGSYGTGDGQFNFPQYLAIDQNDNVYVADTNNNRVQKFSPDGTFIRKWGSLGAGNGELNTPEGIAVDGRGDIYVSDSWNDRVQKFDPDGNYLGQWGNRGIHDGQFENLYGIALDATGNVYSVDVGNDRVQKWAPPEPVIPLAAAFTATPESGSAPLGVRFNDTSTGDPVTWNWSYGDGTGWVNTTDPLQRNVSHQYLNPGSYNATLIVGNGGITSRAGRTILVTPGTTPPPGISGLHNVTYAPTYITWNWTDPSSAEFDLVMVYLDGTFRSNVTKGTRTFTAFSLAPDTRHIISTHTAGTNGAINASWVNSTARTQPAPIITTKIGVFRNTTHMFYLDLNGNGAWNGAGTDRQYTFGSAGDLPVTGDWNNNGIPEIGVYRSSTRTFYLDINGNGVWNGAGTDRQYTFGSAGDLPVTGDWNNNGISEIGVYRPSTHTFYLDINGNGVWNGAGTDRQYTFGSAGDLPVTGDWNNNGISEIGVYRPSTRTFYLDINGNGVWNGASTDRQYTIGATGDKPVSGDWNNDGITEIGVFRPSTHSFYLDYSGNGSWNGAVTDRQYNFGSTGDDPIAGVWS